MRPNRCPQSCHDCPVCFGPLVVNRYYGDSTALPQQPETSNTSYILSCPYCSWTTLDINITFPKSVAISHQLSRLKNGGQSIPEPISEPPKRWELPDGSKEAQMKRYTSEDAAHFFALADFYKSQTEETSATKDSARYLARISARLGPRYLRKQATKPEPLVREACNTNEGLYIHEDNDDTELIEQIKNLGWSGIANATQRAAQPSTTPILSNARPTGTLLRTRRCKRCRTCKKILIKPDHPKNSAHYIMQSVASKILPRLTLQPLSLTTTSTTPTPLLNITPGTPTHYLLHLTNPLYTPLTLTLATPSLTPGPTASRITILCPQFTLDESSDSLAVNNPSKGKISSSFAAVQGQQPEAGKMWEKVGNRGSVVVEVVAGRVGGVGRGGAGEGGDTGVRKDKQGGEEYNDEDEEPESLKIPVFVRGEYSAEVAEGENGEARKIPMESAFWCVLDVGRIVS